VGIAGRSAISAKHKIIMKRKAIYRLWVLLILCFFAIATASAQGGKPVMKVTLPGYAIFVCTSNSMMPMGATAGLITIQKAGDSADQHFDKEMKNNTKFATLDLVYYQQSATGQLTKTKGYHFTNLVVK
jgi:hypothetical protein